VKRAPFQYWLVIFALLARLVLGEVAHAMPYTEHSIAPAQTQECPDHAQNATQDDQRLHHASHGDHSDCCKGSACECACVHVAAFAGARMKTLDRSELSSSRPTLASAQQRATGLFRPPA
jgi:hypothetical protein